MHRFDPRTYCDRGTSAHLVILIRRMLRRLKQADIGVADVFYVHKIAALVTRCQLNSWAIDQARPDHRPGKFVEVVIRAVYMLQHHVREPKRFASRNGSRPLLKLALGERVVKKMGIKFSPFCGESIGIDEKRNLIPHRCLQQSQRVMEVRFYDLGRAVVSSAVCRGDVEDGIQSPIAT